MPKRRLYAALACYGALGLIALAVLDRPFLLAVSIFLGGLAVKTWIAYRQSQ